MGKTSKDSFRDHEKKLHRSTKGQKKPKIASFHNVSRDELIDTVSLWDDNEYNYKGSND